MNTTLKLILTFFVFTFLINGFTALKANQKAPSPSVSSATPLVSPQTPSPMVSPQTQPKPMTPVTPNPTVTPHPKPMTPATPNPTVTPQPKPITVTPQPKPMTPATPNPTVTPQPKPTSTTQPKNTVPSNITAKKLALPVTQIIPTGLKPTILGQINSTNINLYSTIDQTAGLIHIYLTYPGKHWFGIGFGSRMKESDMIINEIVNNTKCQVSDRIALGYLTPVMDSTFGGTEDVNLIQCSIQNNIVTVHINRKLNTGDVNDFQINGPGMQPLIWAWSPSLTLDSHENGGSFGIMTVQLG